MASANAAFARLRRALGPRRPGEGEWRSPGPSNESRSVCAPGMSGCGLPVRVGRRTALAARALPGIGLPGGDSRSGITYVAYSKANNLGSTVVTRWIPREQRAAAGPSRRCPATKRVSARSRSATQGTDVRL